MQIYIYSFISFIVFLFFSKELFYFDEEFLVGLCFFIIFGVLFNLLSSIISNELDNRSEQVYNQFNSFFKIKLQIYNLLTYYYNQRSFNFINEVNNLLRSFILYVKDLFLKKIIMLNYLYKREFVFKLGMDYRLENSYLKNEILNLLITNKTGSYRKELFSICYNYLISSK